MFASLIIEDYASSLQQKCPEKYSHTLIDTQTHSDEQMRDYASKYTQTHCVNAPAATAVVLLLTQQRSSPGGKERERYSTPEQAL